MTSYPYLSLILIIPFVGSILIGFGYIGEYSRKLALLISGVQVAFMGYLGFEFKPNVSHFQFQESYQWIFFNLGSIGNFSAKYALGIDGLSFLLLSLTSFITFIAIWNSAEINLKKAGYYGLILLLNASLMGCFMAQDMMLFYVFFEFMLLPMYFLIGIWGGPNRNYASLKFFIYTLVGSLLILIVMLALSISYADPYETAILNGLAQPGNEFDLEHLYQVQKGIASQEISPSKIVHSFDIQAFSDANNCLSTSILSPNSGWEIGGLSARIWSFWLLFIGFAIKLPIVPFHTWLPDAHVEAPTPVSVLLAGILLKIGAYGWLRITIPFFPQEAVANAQILAILGVLSILYGAYNALAMSDLKKLVAYSSVSHMGFVLVGISAFNVEGLQGAVFQLVSHGILSALLFLMVGVLYKRTGNREIDQFSGLATIMPKFTLISGIAVFSSLGLPGFSGFIGEFFSLMGAFTSAHLSPYIAVLGAFGILLGAGYLLWMFQKIYLGTLYIRDNTWELPDLNKTETISMYALGIISLILGLFPNTIFNYSENFATSFISNLL